MLDSGKNRCAQSEEVSLHDSVVRTAVGRETAKDGGHQKNPNSPQPHTYFVETMFP
jgi:hypothetical protein